MTKKSNTLKKTKIAISLGLLTAGVVVSTIVGINYFNSQQFKYYDLGKFSWNSKTNAQDVVDAINGNKNLISFKNQSIDFLKSKVYTYNLRVLGMCIEAATKNANAIAQKYEAEFIEIINKYFNEDYFETQKNSLTSPFTNVYSKLMELNKKYNIDPIDYHQFKDILLPQVKERILKSVSVVERSVLERKFNFLENNAKDKILNSHLDSFELNKFLAANLNEEGLSEDKEMELVSIQVTKMLNEKSLIVNENPDFDFISSLSPYSLDGKTGYSEKDSKNILSQGDLNKLFLAKRDYLNNSDLLSPDDQITFDDGDKIENETDYAPLDAYVPDVEGMPEFGKNEIIPGYTLHAKITDIDYATNSKETKVSFQLGVSKTDDVNKKVLWISSDDELDDSGYLSCSFKIASFEQKFNCANNFFYPDDLVLSYNNKSFDAKQIPNRTTITDLLHNAPTDANDYYLFNEEHPYLVDVDGLELPGIAKPKQMENNHTNEKLMLAVTNANTNFSKLDSLEKILENGELVNGTDAYRFKNIIPYVDAKWVLADTIPNSNEYEIIKDFKWTNDHNSNINTLPLYFPYSNEELASLQQANVATKFIHDLYTLAYDENGNEVNVADEIYYNMKVTAGLDCGLAGLITIASGFNDVLACITAFNVWSLGTAIVGSVLDGFLAYNGLLAASAKADALPGVQDIVNLVEKFKDLLPKGVAKTYAEFYNKLNDEKVSVDAKLRIALVADNYLYEFCESIFEFLEYASSLTQNEEFMKKEKEWANIFKEDTFFVRSFLTTFTNIDNKTETKEFLNYHNDNIVGAYKMLEKGDIASISDIDQGMIYELKLHRAYFDLYGVFAVGSFMTIKICTMTGIELSFWKRINFIERRMQCSIHNVSSYQPRTIIPSTSARDVKLPINESQWTAEKITAANFIAEQEIQRTENIAGETISCKEQFDKFKERNAKVKSFGKAMAITGVIILVVGVAQLLIDNLYTVIPADKAGIIQQMQAEL